MLYDTIKADLQKARKKQMASRDQESAVKVSILRLLVSEFDTKGNVVPERNDKVIFKKIREYIDANKLVLEHNVEDSDKYIVASMEIAILESYLPKQLSEDELFEIMEDIVNKHNLTNMSGMRVITSELETHYTNQYDKSLLKPLGLKLLT